jgi:hypothetical protein
LRFRCGKERGIEFLSILVTIASKVEALAEQLLQKSEIGIKTPVKPHSREEV